MHPRKRGREEGRGCRRDHQRNDIGVVPIGHAQDGAIVSPPDSYWAPDWHIPEHDPTFGISRDEARVGTVKMQSVDGGGVSPDDIDRLLRQRRVDIHRDTGDECTCTVCV